MRNLSSVNRLDTALELSRNSLVYECKHCGFTLKRLPGIFAVPLCGVCFNRTHGDPNEIVRHRRMVHKTTVSPGVAVVYHEEPT